MSDQSPKPQPVEAKQYDPQLIEEPWYRWWETQGFFHPEPK